MKRNFWRWSFVFFLLVSLPALACNLVSGDDGVPSADGGDEVASSTDDGLPTAVPAATVPSGEDGVAPGEAPELPQFGPLSEALAQFNSYRMQVEMRFEDSGDANEAGMMTMSRAQVLDPPASSVDITFSGSFAEDMEGSGDEVTLAFIEVGDSSYSVVPGLGCMSGLGGAELAGEFDDLLDADEFVGEIEGAEYVGEETVNGVATHHYRFDESSIEQDDDQLRDVNGDIYVSQEHAYVVRMVFDGVGNLDVLEEGQADGSVHFEVNVTDVGQEISIEVPAGCDAAGQEYPVMDGASDVTTFAGLTSYSISATMEDVVSFYQEEMTARGYSAADEQLITESTALMTFSAEGLPTVSVTLSEDGDSVDVLIVSEGN